MFGVWRLIFIRHVGGDAVFEVFKAALGGGEVFLDAPDIFEQAVDLLAVGGDASFRHHAPASSP